VLRIGRRSRWAVAGTATGEHPFGVQFGVQIEKNSEQLRGNEANEHRRLQVVATPAQIYIARKVAEGKTKREAIRCLKRHLVRTIYTTMTATADETPALALGLI